ncbi:MAG: TRAP-type C4-dicarboxylate transport system permease small subunit [Paracoccaceae bacterium]|jgi:TRAP-type C4-dicarboxylate transport system permease small subunit
MAGHEAPTLARRHGGNPFIRTIHALSNVSGWISALMILIAVIIVCQMIFVRFVLNGSTVWQTEVVVFLIVFATLIGLPFVQLRRGHVNVDLVPLALSGRSRYFLAIATLFVSSVIIAIMAFYGYEYWHLAFKRGWTTDTVTAVPLWIPYMSLPLGFGLLLLQMLADLFAIIAKIEKPFGLEAS